MIMQLRNRRLAATAGMVLCAGAALAACQGGTSDDGAGKDTPTAVATATGTSAPAPGATTGANSAPAAAPATKAAGSGSSGSSGSSATRCRTADLGFSFAPGSGAQAVGSQGGIGVVLTNKGGAACTLRGFPGVDIVSSSGAHWSLAREAKSAGKVTVKPGSAASFEITYLPFDEGDSGGSVAFHAASILVTPPDETHSATLKWDGFADVMDQSGATHPGTYVGPVAAGG
jgi:hypothetical protein